LALADLEELHVSEDKIQDLEKVKHHAEPREGLTLNSEFPNFD